MNLFKRIKGILLRPEAEWREIEREPDDPKSLYTDYIAILALIPVISGFISTTIVGIETPQGTLRLSMTLGLVCAVYSYFLTLVIVYIAGHVTNWLAPKFGGQKNFGNALKLSVYSNTPYCLASVFFFIPFLGIVLALYGLYLFYVGAPILMKTPKQRGVLYVATMFVIVFLIALPLGSVQALFWLL